MAIVILNFVLILCLQSICCHDILSKFNQNGYQVKDERTEVIRFNKTIFHNFDFKTFKYNRTTPAFNGTFHSKINLEDKLEDVVQVYKFISNEYRYFPIRFQVNFNKIYGANVLGFQSCKLCGNLTNFVFHKDVIYHFCNFVPDNNRLPPLIPNGLYKIENLLTYLNHEAVLFNLYGEVHTPMTYPKK